MKKKFVKIICCTLLCTTLCGCTQVSINTDIFNKGVQAGAETVEESISQTTDHRTFREMWLDFKENHKIFQDDRDDNIKSSKKDDAIDKILGHYSGKNNDAVYNEKTFKQY